MPSIVTQPANPNSRRHAHTSPLVVRRPVGLRCPQGVSGAGSGRYSERTGRHHTRGQTAFPGKPHGPLVDRRFSRQSIGLRSGPRQHRPSRLLPANPFGRLKNSVPPVRMDPQGGRGEPRASHGMAGSRSKVGVSRQGAETQSSPPGPAGISPARAGFGDRRSSESGCPATWRLGDFARV